MIEIPESTVKRDKVVSVLAVCFEENDTALQYEATVLSWKCRTRVYKLCANQLQRLILQSVGDDPCVFGAVCMNFMGHALRAT